MLCVVCEGVETGERRYGVKKRDIEKVRYERGEIEIDRPAWSETELSAMIDLAG